MSNYVFGSDEQGLLGGSPKYFYGLRRTIEGELYLAKLNQLNDDDIVEINIPGPVEENFVDFEAGVDFVDGRNTDHELEYANLKYEQLRWDNRSLYYYINEEGQLVVRINRKYTYPTGI